MKDILIYFALGIIIGQTTIFIRNYIESRRVKKIEEDIDAVGRINHVVYKTYDRLFDMVDFHGDTSKAKVNLAYVNRMLKWFESEEVSKYKDTIATTAIVNYLLKAKADMEKYIKEVDTSTDYSKYIDFKEDDKTSKEELDALNRIRKFYVLESEFASKDFFTMDDIDYFLMSLQDFQTFLKSDYSK